MGVFHFSDPRGWKTVRWMEMKLGMCDYVGYWTTPKKLQPFKFTHASAAEG